MTWYSGDRVSGKLPCGSCSLRRGAYKRSVWYSCRTKVVHWVVRRISIYNISWNIVSASLYIDDMIPLFSIKLFLWHARFWPEVRRRWGNCELSTFMITPLGRLISSVFSMSFLRIWQIALCTSSSVSGIGRVFRNESHHPSICRYISPQGFRKLCRSPGWDESFCSTSERRFVHSHYKAR